MIDNWTDAKTNTPEIGKPLILWVECHSNPDWTGLKFGMYDNDKYYLRGGTQYGDIEVTHYQSAPIKPIP